MDLLRIILKAILPAKFLASVANIKIIPQRAIIRGITFPIGNFWSIMVMGHAAKR